LVEVPRRGTIIDATIVQVVILLRFAPLAVVRQDMGTISHAFGPRWVLPSGRVFLLLQTSCREGGERPTE